MCACPMRGPYLAGPPVYSNGDRWAHVAQKALPGGGHLSEVTGTGMVCVLRRLCQNRNGDRSLHVLERPYLEVVIC